MKVGPDGTVYVPNSSCSAGTGSQGMAVSLDNGLTWVDYTVPSSVGSGDPSVGVGSDNTVYLGYVNGDGRPHIAVSTDHGATWTNDYDVGTPVGCAPGDQYAACRIKSAVFPVVVAGDGDRAAFGFLGSTTGGNYQDQATFQGIWNFYVATTYDRGAHWVTVNATEGDPVQKGSICLLGVICGDDRNLLDFNDISVDREGRSVAAYADGCVAPGCSAANDYTGRDNKAAIVRQLSGRRLFAAFDPPTLISISGTVSYCPNPHPRPVPNVTLTLTGSASDSRLSDSSGNYQFSSVPGGGSYTVTPTKSARTPGSPGINTVDVIAVQQHYLNLAVLPAGCRRDAANVNGDTLIDTVDVIAIQRFFLGLSTGIANTGKYQFTPASRTYSGVGSNQTGQNYTTLVFGDVAGDSVEGLDDGPTQDAAGDDMMSAGESAPTVAAVALPEIAVDQLRMLSRVESKSNFIAAVTASAIDGDNRLVGFQGDLTFDERVVTFESQPVQKAGMTGGNWNVSGNVLPGAGPIRTLRISAYSNDFTPLSGSGTLFELRMTRVSQAAQGTQLLWAAAPNQFIFIDADLKTQQPGKAAPGSVSPSRK